MAMTTTAYWEVRDSGDDDNGGAYKVGAGTTDYSLQDAAQLTAADGANVTPSHVFTSAGGGFTAQMVGNFVHVWDAGGGANIVDGWYEIQGYTDTNNVTLDREIDDAVGNASGATFKVGGCLATFERLADIDDGGAGVLFHHAWVRSGTYNATGNAINLEVSFVSGYGATRGDGTRTTVNMAGMTAGQNGVIPPDHGTLADLIFTNAKAIAVLGGNQASLHRIKASGAGSHGFSGTSVICYDCEADANTGTGFNTCFGGYGCLSTGNAIGFDKGNWTDSVAYDNTADGFGGTQEKQLYSGCVSHSNGGDGFDFRRRMMIVNCIAWGNTGYGFNFQGTATNQRGIIEGCAAGSNTAGNVESSDTNQDFLDQALIVLTGDPCTNAAGGDFSLDATAGEGAACRAAGVSPVGQTSYGDVGAVQHEDAAGGGGGLKIVGTGGLCG